MTATGRSPLRAFHSASVIGTPSRREAKRTGVGMAVGVGEGVSVGSGESAGKSWNAEELGVRSAMNATTIPMIGIAASNQSARRSINQRGT